MGNGDEESPLPKRSLHEKYGNWKEEKALDKARLAVWMNGREPRQWWEEYENKEFARDGKFFCMEFPTTVHYFVVVWEPAHEWGPLFVWCMGCKNSLCGACKWARNEYRAATKREFHSTETTTKDLPF